MTVDTVSLVGTFVTPDGVVMAGATVTFRPKTRKIFSYDGNAVAPKETVTTTDEAGAIDCEIVPGNYRVIARTETHEFEGTAAIPADLTGAVDIAGCIDAEPVQDLITAAAAPTSGTWSLGALVYNSAPAAGGFIGWVCVTAGTPGTWKGWGAIEP